QKPATIVLPAQSITRASGGIWISLARPTALMAPPDMTTTASGSGAASGEAYAVPAFRTSVCALATVAVATAEPSRPRDSAARSQLPNLREVLRFFMMRPDAEKGWTQDS